MGDDVHGVLSVQPEGTNSTMFTACCGTAICNDQVRCPQCGDFIVGYDAPSDHARGRVRWSYATRHWDRKALGCYGY